MTAEYEEVGKNRKNLSLSLSRSLSDIIQVCVSSIGVWASFIRTNAATRNDRIINHSFNMAISESHRLDSCKAVPGRCYNRNRPHAPTAHASSQLLSLSLLFMMLAAMPASCLALTCKYSYQIRQLQLRLQLLHLHRHYDGWRNKLAVVVVRACCCYRWNRYRPLTYLAAVAAAAATSLAFSSFWLWLLA